MTRARSALLVSGERADCRFGLHPLAKAMVPMFDRVTHAVLQSSSPPTDRSEESASEGERTVADGVVRLRCPVAPFPRQRGSVDKWLTPSPISQWASRPCAGLDPAAASADLVIVQSGEAAAMLMRVRRSAPAAKLAYFATEPIGTGHPPLGVRLARHRRLIDCAVTIVPGLRSELAPFAERALQLPFPFDPTLLATVGPSPYREGPSIVVVDGGALDSVFVQIAASSFPQAVLFLIGDLELDTPANVQVLGQLSGSAALPFLVHADAAIVASPAAGEAPHDVDLAQKLAMFDYLGTPVVCPASVTENHARRYGYDPGRTASVRQALARALAAEPKRLPGDLTTWAQLAHALVRAAFLDRTGQAVVLGPETAHAG